MKTKQQYVIRSIFRGNEKYFAAIHGYSAQFFGLDKAKCFDTEQEAHDYALRELFETEDAFVVEPL